MTDTLGFNKIPDDQVAGDYYYGVRGSGAKYREFYTWLNNLTIKDQYSDFPWHFIKFANSYDERMFLSKYGDSVDDLTV